MNNFAILLWIIKAVNLIVKLVTVLTNHFMLRRSRKQCAPFPFCEKKPMINSFRYEYACGILVNISYQNKNQSFIGDLLAVEDVNRRQETGVKERQKHIERVRSA